MLHTAPRLIRHAAILSLLFSVVGCASKASVSSWQKSVTDYVKEQGAGDPIVLREVTLPDARPGFSVIGHHDAPVSTDVNGVLLGYDQIGERLWFIYLVGVVDKHQVTDIRLDALSMHRGKMVWKRGPASKQALEAYRQHGIKQARERFPDRKTPPPKYLGFPRADDEFSVSKGEGGRIQATHSGSGARWELTLPEKSR
ncbi:MAG: hypothetical protein WBD40_24915 [Tepidisphaeraceae bacterium]